MRCIIAGGREIVLPDILFDALDICPFAKEINTVICGMAPGVDTLGWKWAILNGIPVIEFPADWNKHRRAAGVIRNTQMIVEGKADALLAIPGKGPGTRHMIKEARKYNLKVCVYEITT